MKITLAEARELSLKTLEEYERKWADYLKEEGREVAQ